MMNNAGMKGKFSIVRVSRTLTDSCSSRRNSQLILETITSLVPAVNRSIQDAYQAVGRQQPSTSPRAVVDARD